MSNIDTSEKKEENAIVKTSKMKQNWFKIGVLIILAIQIAFISYYLLERNQIMRDLSKMEIEAFKDQQKLPECDVGRCPQFFSMDVDKDGLPETAAIIPVGMTKGAGKLWIIKNGKLIFDTSVLAEIWIKEVSDGNGFILSYAPDTTYPEKTKEIRYFYKDGKFVN